MANLMLKVTAAFALALLLSIALVACGEGGFGDSRQAAEGATPLRMGLLLNFSEGSAERAVHRQRGFDLAVKHLNQGGGVFGMPVETVAGDSTLDPAKAATEASRLVEVEGIHVLVGPSSSANALAVAKNVTGPAGIPTISPSATAPTLTDVPDRDYLFRTALSDSAQGPVLARVVRQQGIANVGLVYRNDAWGQGLANAFQEAWTEEIRAVAIEPDEATYLPQLRQSAGGGAQALVLLTFDEEAVTILEESLDSGLYDRFAFGDALRSPELVSVIGGKHLGGMYGTGAGIPPASASLAAWEEAYIEEYGSLPEYAYVKETYDAAIALALAAQAAGSVDGTAIRDQVRSVGSGPGTPVIAGQEGVAEALRILAAGGTADYQGAASSLDWDEHGDLSKGHIGVWRFTEDGDIEEVEVVAIGE